DGRAGGLVAAHEPQLPLTVDPPVAAGQPGRIGVGRQLGRGLELLRAGLHEVPGGVRLVDVRVRIDDWHSTQPPSGVYGSSASVPEGGYTPSSRQRQSRRRWLRGGDAAGVT